MSNVNVFKLLIAVLVLAKVHCNSPNSAVVNSGAATSGGSFDGVFLSKDLDGQLRARNERLMSILRYVLNSNSAENSNDEDNDDDDLLRDVDESTVDELAEIVRNSHIHHPASLGHNGATGNSLNSKRAQRPYYTSYFPFHRQQIGNGFFPKRSSPYERHSFDQLKGKRVNKNMFSSGLQGVWGVPGRK